MFVWLPVRDWDDVKRVLMQALASEEDVIFFDLFAQGLPEDVRRIIPHCKIVLAEERQFLHFALQEAKPDSLLIVSSSMDLSVLAETFLKLPPEQNLKVMFRPPNWGRY
jgi:hypothetical protein